MAIKKRYILIFVVLCILGTFYSLLSHKFIELIAWVGVATVILTLAAVFRRERFTSINHKKKYIKMHIMGLCFVSLIALSLIAFMIGVVGVVNLNAFLGYLAYIVVTVMQIDRPVEGQ